MVLLDPETWRGLTLRQYGFWASDVWKALFETAKRRYRYTLNIGSFENLIQGSKSSA